MSEEGYVERPILQWLSGPGGGSQDIGLGWTYRDSSDMLKFDRPIEDPLVERLLIEAIIRINPDVTTDHEARLAISALRKAMLHGDKLRANRETLERLRDGVSLSLALGKNPTTVRFIDFSSETQHLNDFTATNQYRVQGVKQCRDDCVLLVNGIPLVIAEYKSYITSGSDWKEAVNQLHRYQRHAPLMLTPNVFCVAADEEEFRFGTVLFHDASADDIERHIDSWGPWLSLYPERKGWWNDPEADEVDDALEIPVKGLLRLRPCHVLDFLQNFIVFETKKGRTTKKIARYQQFEAVNEIVARTLSRIGKSVDSQDRTGLIWHTQGSGKSLTMVFAGNKLRREPALQNPTVLIVVDRRDLKTQLADDFEACDYPNVVKALGIQDLKHKLRSGWRGTLVTTIQSFQEMGDLEPLGRDNIISLVDEAHRSQKGKGSEGYAMTMRVKLQNAFRFGFTGTPIDRTMQNTHREFGPIEDGVQERYLSYYGIRRAIKDGATLPVHYLRDRVPFFVDESPLNVGFEKMCEEAEVEDEGAKDFVQRQTSRWKDLACHPKRMNIVIDKMIRHFLEHPEPSGFKAQLVAVDRKACALYKDLLDVRLRAHGLPTEWSDVIISSAQNSEPNVARFEYAKSVQDDLIDYYKLTPVEWTQWNFERYGDDRSKWRPALKILIVCDRLLTGFDAPVEQVMYLDKPIRDHNLLQAIARTNRPLPQLQKLTGLIVDYFGVFANLEKALNFDETIREESLIDWNALKATVPTEVALTMEPFADIAIEDTRSCLLTALRRLRDPDTAKAFEASFKQLQRLWEAIAPDACLYPYKAQYAWLCGIYVGYRRRQHHSTMTYGNLTAKTREMIRDHTTFIDIAESSPVFKIDQDYIRTLEAFPTAADKAAALEAALTQELSEDEPGFIYRQLGERLQRLRSQRDTGDASADARLRELDAIAAAAAETKTEPARLNLPSAVEYGVFTILRAHSANRDESYLAECARTMVRHLREKNLLSRGWSTTRGGRMRVEQSLLAESWNPGYSLLAFDRDNPEPLFLKPTVDELARHEG